MNVYTEMNPYESPSAAAVSDPAQRKWKGGVDSILVIRRLLQRKVIVNNPVEVTIEYFARGLRDRIIVDGNTVVSIIPIVWLHKRFDFEIPFCDGQLPATAIVQVDRFLRLERFEIHINGVVAYYEENDRAQPPIPRNRGEEPILRRRGLVPLLCSWFIQLEFQAVIARERGRSRILRKRRFIALRRLGRYR